MRATVRRARILRSLSPSLLVVLLVGAPEIAAGQQGSARPSIEIRLAGEQAWGRRASAEQQPGLDVTFFLRVSNEGDAPGTFLVRGDHGGATFAVRYLEGGAGDDRITGAVVDGTYELPDVPAGGTRTLRIRVRADGGAAIDRTGDWTIEVASADDASSHDAAGAEVRTVAKAFARAGGVTLRVPAAEASITFHESLFEQAAALRPLGTLLRNANPAFDPPPDGPGPGYVVMDSRGRSTPPTSGSDDVVDADEPILAPVSGTVIRVTSYELYCEWSDVRIAIRPDQNPDRTVQVFHLVDPSVDRGDRVVVSRTVLGRARLFPFRSQTQDYGLGGRHVHLEIERDGSAPLPGCGGQAIP
jgi:hypothetical protein